MSMKKLSVMALAAALMAPVSMQADSWQKTVTNASEFKTAFKAVGAGNAGETYEIICDWDASDVQSVGKLKPTLTKGKLIIRSNETNFDKMPQLVIALDWSADASEKAEEGQGMSLIFENMNLKGSGSYLVDHRRAIYADTIALRHCDIHGQTRSILRLDGDKGAVTDGEGNKLTAADYLVRAIDVKECRIHGTAQVSGDNWSVFRTFMPVLTFDVYDNMFYDMPYTKSLWETRTPGDEATVMNFHNNLVLLGENKNVASTGFIALMAADKLAAGSQIYMNNNIFMGPKKGVHTLVNDTSSYSATKVTNLAYGVVVANNNLVDTESYMPLDELNDSVLAALNTTLVGAETTKTLADFPEFSWETGATFQEPENDLYFIANSNAWKTAGVDANLDGHTYLGPSIAYVEQFPIPAALNIKVNGPEYITYSLSPEKAKYYVGDEVSVKFNDHNSAYRTLNSFTGWSDDASLTNPNRTLTLAAENNLTANFEAVVTNAVSVIDFSKITGSQNLDSYDADIYVGDYKTVVTMMVADTTNGAQAPFNYVLATSADRNFQSRAAKFGEDDSELQIPIISRRSPAVAHQAGQVNYAVFTLTSKDLDNIKFSCFVGSDNFIFKKQLLDYSVDGGQTWTNFASAEFTDETIRDAKFGDVDGKLFGWLELAGTLPAEANNKEALQIRVISDPSSEALLNLAAGDIDVTANDNFEYIGQVLITADITNGISDVTMNSDKTFNANAPVYNLMGMKIQKAQKGLYIQNGKKYIVK